MQSDKRWDRRCAAVLCLGAALLAADVAPAGDAAPTASMVVEKLHQVLLDAMRGGPEIGYTERYDLIDDDLEAIFDFGVIARMTLGPRWSDLESGQQAEFIDVFKRYTIATYASRFNTYDGQRFETKGEREQRRSVVVVRTHFITAAGKVREFDYQLIRTDARWRIVNIAVDGVSDVSLKRSQYADLIAREGFASLVRTLEDRIHRMATGRSEES